MVPGIDVKLPPTPETASAAICAKYAKARDRCRGSLSKLAGSCKPPLKRSSGFCLTCASMRSIALLNLSRFALQGLGAAVYLCQSNT